MADDREYPERGYTTEDVETQRTAPKRRRRRWALIALGVLVVLPVAALTLWTWVVLQFSYSTGDRTGYVRKLSQKGWVCKTWEGELAMVNVPGERADLFNFTVRDDAVARRINDLEGQRVAIHYEQHAGVPTSCFGETDYFVTEVRPVRGP